MVTFVLTSSRSFGQSALLGAALIKLGDQLQQSIDDAKNAGLNVEIQGGREISLAIESFKNAYASSLNLTMDKLDTTVTNQFENLKSLTDAFSSNTAQTLGELTSKAQQIVNSLPFRKHEPQLTSFTPTYVVPSTQSYNISITCQGNFEAAAEPKMRPTLTIGNKTFQAAGGNQTLQIKVPVDSVKTLPDVQQGKINYIIGNLNVPWRDSKFLGIFHPKRLDKYVLYIGILPKQPGTLTLQHTIDSPRHTVKSFMSSTFYQSSGVNGANDDHKDVPWLVTPDQGWHVVRNSSGFFPGNNVGDWSKSFISDDGDRVHYNVTTIHHGLFGTSGELFFRIGFDEYLDDNVKVTHSVPFDINWGDSRTIDYGVGTWKLVFKAFDGSTHEFVGDDPSNPFIQIVKSGMTYMLVTANPNTLKWP